MDIDIIDVSVYSIKDLVSAAVAFDGMDSDKELIMAFISDMAGVSID